MDGLAQCVMFEDGKPGLVYTYGMEALGRGLDPHAKRILVLGLGGGILPMRFARPDVEIDVVEINPESVPLAEEYFGYDQSAARHHIMDARVYVRKCETKYNLIFADLFHGDSTPDYLLTVEFMRDLAKCLAPPGGAVFNMVGHGDPRFESALYSYVKTARAAWPNVLLFHGGNPGMRNLMILASGSSLESYRPAKIAMPREVREAVDQMLVAPRPINRQRLEAAPILTDDFNVSSVQHAWFYLQTRGLVLSILPAPLLVN